MPQHLKLIRLELAREPGHPEGDRKHGYEIIAPLDKEDRIDLKAWQAAKARCRVRRFTEDEEEIGRLVHRRSGWVIDYDPKSTEDDEQGFRLGEHLFRIGEYVSIREHDDKLHTFRVVSVRDVPA